MDYGTLIGNSFTYVKEGIIDKVNKWLLLMIATLILTIPLMGYIMNVYRGTKPAPEVQDWGKLIVDGILLFIVGIIYAIPIIILEFLMIGATFATTMESNPTAMMTSLASAGILAVILIIVAIIIALGSVTWLYTHTLDPFRPIERISDCAAPAPIRNASSSGGTREASISAGPMIFWPVRLR